MPKKPKQNQKNKRTFFLTDENLAVLSQVSEKLLSEINYTKFVNFAIDFTYGTWLKTHEIEAKTPAQKQKLIFNLTNEIKKYASTEETFR